MTEDTFIVKGKKWPYNHYKIYLSNYELNSIRDIENLNKLNDLKILCLPGNNIEKIEFLENNQELIKLDLDRNNIKKIEGLEKLDSLEKLQLRSNQISVIENLESLKNFKVLILTKNNIKKIENLENLEKLEEIRLSDNLINKIENLDHLKNLKHLEMLFCPLSKIEGLSNLKQLKYLSIGSFPGYPNNINEIEGLEHLISLEEINIAPFDLKSRNKKSLVIILRFACMVKQNNYLEIEDWKYVFKNFPSSFFEFQEYNSPEKIEWFLFQCSKNLLNVIDNIKTDQNYEEILKNQENEWDKIKNVVDSIFS